jgi:hypothetical protein
MVVTASVGLQYNPTFHNHLTVAAALRKGSTTCSSIPAIHYHLMVEAAPVKFQYTPVLNTVSWKPQIQG